MKTTHHHPWQLLLAGLVVLALAGCSAPSGHEQYVQAAKDRYHKQRAELMLPLAKDQFLANDLGEAKRTVVQALSIDPTNAEFYVLSGRIEVEQNRLERGIQGFNIAIELDPELAVAHYHKGEVLQRWRKYEDAFHSYEQAFKVERDRPDYLMAVAEILILLDRQDESLALLESKKDYFEFNAGIRLAIGHLYVMKDDHATAARYFEEAHHLHGEDESILEELAMAQLGAGRSGDAARNLKRLTELPELRDRKDLRHALASAYLQGGQKRQARALYRRLTSKDGQDWHAWWKLGEMDWAEGDTARALNAARRVVELAPGQHEGYLLAGMVWQGRGQLSKALKMFNKATTLAPQDVTASIMQGLVLQKAGRLQAAADAYRRALGNRPDDPRILKLLAQVDTGGQDR